MVNRPVQQELLGHIGRRELPPHQLAHRRQVGVALAVDVLVRVAVHEEREHHLAVKGGAQVLADFLGRGQPRVQRGETVGRDLVLYLARALRLGRGFGLDAGGKRGCSRCSV